jgi:hypothetical protein
MEPEGNGEMVELEVPVIPFVPLFATRVWLEEDSLSMPAGMAEAEGSGRKAGAELS